MKSLLGFLVSLILLNPEISFTGEQPETNLDVNIFLRCGMTTTDNNRAFVKTTENLQSIGADEEVCVSKDTVITSSEVQAIKISKSMSTSDKYNDPLWSKIIDDLEDYDIEIVNNNSDFFLELLLDKKGAKKLEGITMNNIGEQLVITIDNIAYSIPILVEPILNGRLFIEN